MTEDLEEFIDAMHIVTYTLVDGSRVVGEEREYDYSNGIVTVYGVLEFHQYNEIITLSPYVPESVDTVFVFTDRNIIGRGNATFELKSFFLSIILVLIFVFFSDLIFSLFIDDIKTNLIFFKIMSVSLIFVFMSSYNGPLGLVILKKDSLWTKSTLFGLYAFVALISILIITDLVTLLNFALVIVFAELIVYLFSKKFLNDVSV